MAWLSVSDKSEFNQRRQSRQTFRVRGDTRRYAAVHALQHYDEAMNAFTRMLPLVEGSLDQDIRRQCLPTSVKKTT